jgi:hypothetical protein
MGPAVQEYRDLANSDQTWRTVAILSRAKKNTDFKSSFLIAHIIHPMAHKEQASKRETPQETEISLVWVVFIA